MLVTSLLRVAGVARQPDVLCRVVHTDAMCADRTRNMRDRGTFLNVELRINFPDFAHYLEVNKVLECVTSRSSVRSLMFKYLTINLLGVLFSLY